MFKELLKRSEVLQEYVGEIKVIYQQNVIEVINYQRLISIYEKEVLIEKLIIKGNELKVIYQDPVKIKIKGKIDSVMINDAKNGI